MSYRTVSGAVFVLIAVAHAIRATLGLPIQIGSHAIGLSISWIAAVIAAALGYWAFRGE